MARGVIAVTDITKAGVAPPAETDGDAVNFHTVPNSDGRTFLLVRNANGASTARVLTVVLSGAIDGFAPVPRTYSIPAGASRYIGPFDVGSYGSNLLINPDNAELKITALRAG